MIMHSTLWFDRIQSVSITYVYVQLICIHSKNPDFFAFERDKKPAIFQIELKLKKYTLMNVCVYVSVHKNVCR